MNDRVKLELLEEAAGRNAAGAIGEAAGAGALIVAQYEGDGYSFRDDGWFNATEAAKRYNKEPAQWQRLPETVAYVVALERRYGKDRDVLSAGIRGDQCGGRLRQLQQDDDQLGGASATASAAYKCRHRPRMIGSSFMSQSASCRVIRSWGLAWSHLTSDRR